MKKILFICTHNSSRSQMAEGLVNQYYSKDWQAFSAGMVKTSVNKFTIESMKQIGIDITTHFSKTLDIYLNNKFDVVVTVCDNAKETCPFFPGAKLMLHAGFEDPSQFKGTDEEILIRYNLIRDQIKKWLDENLQNFN